METQADQTSDPEGQQSSLARTPQTCSSRLAVDQELFSVCIEVGRLFRLKQMVSEITEDHERNPVCSVHEEDWPSRKNAVELACPRRFANAI
jgi:hypothetical protein